MKRPKPILTKLSDSPKKQALINKPLRINSLPSEQQNRLENDLMAQGFLTEHLLPNRCDRSRSLSVQKSRVSQLGNASKHERGRSLMDGYLAGLLSQLKKTVNTKQVKQIERMTFQLSQIVDFQLYVTEFFECYNRCFRLLILSPQNVVALHHVPLDLKLQKKILFSKASLTPDKNGKRKQLESIMYENEELKKQIFKIRENNSILQKRTLRLIAQYKERKLVYMGQIQRLTGIIKTAIQKIPQIIIQRNKNKQKGQDKKKGVSTNVQSQNPVKNQYNTLSNINDPINFGLQNTYRVLNATIFGGLGRFASEEKQKTNK